MVKDEIEKLKKKIEELEKAKEEYLKEWQRARADLINYKKEEKERIEDLLKKANENLIFEFLWILDNFEVAEKNIPPEKREDPHIKGLLQIKNQVVEFFKKYGLEEIKTVGEKFDPFFHEAIEEVTGSQFESGVVVEEIQKGYKINNKVLRPAKVKVAK